MKRTNLENSGTGDISLSRNTWEARLCDRYLFHAIAPLINASAAEVGEIFWLILVLWKPKINRHESNHGANMYDTTVEVICVEDLFKLSREIQEYIESVCAAEQAEEENNPDVEYIKERVVERGLAFKRRIKHFYIDLGIAKDIEKDVANLPVVEVVLPSDELAA